MHEIVGEHVFPFIGTLGGEGSTYSTHMRDARYTIPSAALLRKVVDGLESADIDRLLKVVAEIRRNAEAA
jgi:type I restriction enzyme M protein